MKVSHNEDYDTHAVIGGKDIEAFEIAQTAEFFTVLSDTLYSNKPLAMVREYLCNAWDSHIESGRTDLAIEVTLTNDSIRIKDFGRGIPHNKIHSIFCVYGHTTKANDGLQTGGFGLGSKAGFAVSDHLTVTNCREGWKVVHAISKGSARTMGKPDRRVMVRVPTTEEGLEVSVPLKGFNGEFSQYEDLVKQVASWGEMNVKLNGRTISTVPLSKTITGLFITNRKIPNSNALINVRYGNVVYPVPNPGDKRNTGYAYREVYNKLITYLGKIEVKYPRDKWNLVVQAPPNSLSVTPSRESLSMTETSVKTIDQLLTEIYNYISIDNSEYKKEVIHHFNEAVNYLYQTARPHIILEYENIIKYTEDKQTVRDFNTLYDDIMSLRELTKYRLCTEDTYFLKNRSFFNKLRYKALIEGGFRHTHHLKDLMNLSKTRLSKIHRRDTYQKKFVRPLIRKIAGHPVLDPRKLFVANPVIGRYRQFGWVLAGNYRVEPGTINALLSAMIVVTYSRQSYAEECNSRTFKRDLPRLVYVAPRKGDHKDEAVKFFRKLGYYVRDFAEETKVTTVKFIPQKVKESKPKKPEGLIQLTSLLGPANSGLSKYYLSQPQSCTYIKDPEYIIYLTKKDDIFPWGHVNVEFLIREYGSNIGIATTAHQYDNYIKKGAKEAYGYIATKICEEVLKSPRILTMLDLKSKYLRHRDIVVSFMQLGKYSKVIKKALNIPDLITEKEEHILDVYNIMSVKRHLYGIEAWELVVKETQDTLDKKPYNKNLTTLIERVIQNPRLNYIQLEEITDKLEEISGPKPDYNTQVFLETLVLVAIS